ncbi:hypothetical protein [Nitrospirillum viridazoti]|uniref:hypothetical protein n=1 Tax=Nitrospirillum viridazoti TaxID=3144925 RepID=UPI0011A9FC36|nr:hypothetical protein [Nitrospirillum amazonense]TWB28671.1 hypothetical protein FBZ91_1285 [Nitrospirillum amazonense]
MTLILGYTFHDSPILIGDVLLSNDGSSDELFNTPTYNNVNIYMNKRKAHAHVTGMKQKVNILSDKLIIAWAGSYVQARAVMRELKEFHKKGEITQLNIMGYMEKIPPEDSWNLSLIGFIRGETHTSYFYRDAIRLEHKYLSNVLIAGSGFHHMAQILSECEMPTTAEELQIFDNNYMAMATMNGLWLAAQATGIEVMTGENFLDRWGGAIKIAMFNAGKAAKIGNILYTFWDSIDNGQKIKHLKIRNHFIKTEYQDDMLVTRTLREYESTPTPKFQEKICAIPPILSTRIKGERISVYRPSLNYDYISSTIMHWKDNRIENVFSSVHKFGISEKPIRLSQIGENISIIPTSINYEPLAHCRSPMDMMR